jgi:hypothetical protein
MKQKQGSLSFSLLEVSDLAESKIELKYFRVFLAVPRLHLIRAVIGDEAGDVIVDVS